MKRIMAMAMLAAATALGACDDEGGTGVDPAMAVVAGSYTAEGGFGAITFTSQEQGSTEVVDWLDAGASLVLRLRADGTTTGRLFVPGVDEDGGDLDENLAGTWSLSGSVVEFEHEADTFVRDMTFEYADGFLTGEETFSDTTLRVVMQRR